VDDVVGQGTLLAGRYRMLQPITSDLVGAMAWEATDRILDRPVRVAIFTAGHVPQALDAARRAALVTDPRLVRVLDVGDHEGVSYLVTEPVHGPSLAELVAHEPLPADQARAIVGEAAAALEAARRRGVHHLALRPSVLHLTPDDRVLLTGLAVDGALLGEGQGDARSTTRTDTVGLVELLYAALTGRWPGKTGGASEDESGSSIPRLPAAPRLEGSPVAPSELIAGVPNDLDTLCAVTLGANEDGPHSPAELILELEPWGDIRGVDLLAATRAPAPEPTTTAIAAIAEPERPVPPPPTVRRQSVRSAFATTPATAAGRPGTPPPAVPARASAYGTAAAVGSGGEAAAALAAAALAAASSAATSSAATSTAATSGAAASGATASGATASASTSPPTFAPTSRQTTAPDPARTAAPAPTATQILSVAPPAAAPPHARASSAPTAEPVHHPRAFGELVAAREAIHTKRFDPTRLVLAVVVVVVLVGLYLAFRALTSPIGTTSPAAAPRPSASASAAQSAAPSATTGAAVANPAAGAPAIASGQMIDPPPGGDNNEHPEAAPLAVDGNPATVWFTRTYKSAAFAGLKKGVGYAVNLTAPATVTTVTLQVNGTGGRVEVRATDPSTPTQGTVLAEGTLSANTVLTLSAPTATQHIVLWFTALPQTTDGSNRIELAEVTLS